jgi:membrane-associated protein
MLHFSAVESAAMLDTLLHFMRSVPPWAVVAFAFLIPAAETALVLGLFLPGELAIVAAGILASRADVGVVPVILAAIAGSIVGDSLGYLAGGKYRTTLSRRLTASRWKRAKAWLQRRGGPAVLMARYTAFVRSVMPAVAGAARFPYRRFLLWSSAAGVTWGSASVLLGYLAARNAEVILRWMGVFGIVVLVAVLVALYVFFHKRRRRSGGNGVVRRLTAPFSGRPGSRRRLPTPRGRP